MAERAKKAIRTDRYTDLWHGVKVVYKAFQEGNDNLDLMPLGGLFKADQCPLLDACELDNEHLMKAIRQLRWNDIDGVKTFTDYRNMGTEEFGSVYESLLELVPHVDLQAKTFSFVGVGDEDGIIEDGSTKGNARKLSGSYYTDASLVQSLIKTALEPAIEAKLKAEEDLARKENREPDYERAILDFRMIDAGSGSGHFLLAGSRRLAEVLSEKRLEKTGESATAETYRKALRDVITNCIYGVDLNEMAVELARTALWLEGYEPGKPLEFLNHHIKQGNSIVGVFDLKVLNNGVPKAAYSVLTGDDKNVCSDRRKINELECGGKSRIGMSDKKAPITNDRLVALTKQIESLPNDDIRAEERKRELYEKLQQDSVYVKNKLACDVYTAAFFAKKNDLTKVPTSKDLFDVMNDLEETKQGIRELATNLSEEYSFFHWPVEFPEVFAKGGFDCVVGNPPWDVSQLNEIEFFANLLPEIAVLSGNDRKIAIDKLKKEKPHIYDLYEVRKHALEVENSYYGNSGRFPLTSYGKVNLYSRFAELNYNLRNKNGSAGFVCPSGIATDDSTKNFFEKIASSGELRSLYDFENKEGIFPNVHKMYKFCLLTILRGDAPSDYVFFLKNVAELEDKRRHFTMTSESFKLINPNTHTCPVFRSMADAKLAEKIYCKSGIFVNESVEENDVEKSNPWHVDFQQMYNMSSASNLFAKAPGVGPDAKPLLPLYEGKFIHQFDHRWGTYKDVSLVTYKEDPRDITLEERTNRNYFVVPRYYVSCTETVLRTTRFDKSVVSLLRKAIAKNDNDTLHKLYENCQQLAMTETDLALQQVYTHACECGDIVQYLVNAAENSSPKYLLGFRDVTNALNERTTIFSVIPFCGVGHNMPVCYVKRSEKEQACLLANVNSLVFDYVSRLKIGGLHLTYGYLKQLPVLSPSTYTEQALGYIVPRVFALTYTATDIVEWARALWNDASVDLRKLILAQHKDLPTGTDIETLVSSDFDPATIPPIVFEDAHRAKLRAELDAYFAKLYGLSRRDLEYILDPKTVMGDDYPSETFRVLRDAELSTYGEYRTQRLVLEAWDKMN